MYRHGNQLLEELEVAIFSVRLHLADLTARISYEMGV